MKRILFIINPKAGVDRIKALQKEIERNIDHRLFQYEVVYTEYAKHGTLLARKGVEAGFDLIVAVGGDGSVNDVVNGIYGTNATLGIIPKGSGNGLARSLKIPMNQSKALLLLNKWKVRKIDVGTVENHLFVSNAGVGFDVQVIEDFSKSSRRGLLTYLTVILKDVWKYPVKEWDICADEEKIKNRFFMLTVANASQLGYGFKIAPGAELDDGFFDLVTIRRFPKVMASGIALRAFSGKISGSPLVSVRKVKEITISHPDLSILQFDGEAAACGDRITIKMMPEKLRVLS